jgi:methylated-DNA-[protein]-cysteine S-methyltransferase
VKNTKLRYVISNTAWGAVALVASGEKILGSYLPQKNKTALKTRIGKEFPGAVAADKNDPLLAKGTSQLQGYFEGKLEKFDLPLDLTGFAPFQTKVYRALKNLGYGKTISYGQLAAKAGSPAAARAVGQAMAKNRLAPLIPCHRVLGADGSLTGFSSTGGVDQKKKMLLMESGKN